MHVEIRLSSSNYSSRFKNTVHYGKSRFKVVYKSVVKSKVWCNWY